MSQLLARSKVVPACVPAVVGAGAVTCVEVDATKWDRVLYVIQTGAVGAAGSTLIMHVHEAAATGMAGASDITGATMVLITGVANLAYAIDVPVNPAKPIQILVGTVGVNTYAVSASAILYNGSGVFPKSDAATQAVIV